MIIKFITALAWMWGIVGLCGLVVFLTHDGPPTRENEGCALYGIFMGMPSWAWLIARYLL